ncbi:type IV pilus modification PilV family protein [Ideonella sp. BN130291]|uniref:type IV pilus modification PilV family protein n=1 Tax=Ideonella sp. BN130291 TaxID=3112940 RepID=UPI002E26B4EE|nr:prepilin-type N-terminal cleavage/methylation domain-containing protein [Ideonella sp. BN130291]
MDRRFISCRPQRGVALIEALIGMLIFAFGVMGLVGLQASMTRAQTSSKLRGDATNLASEIIGTMWTDTANIAKYGNCDTYDRCKAWQDKVAGMLPNGEGATSVSAAGAVQVSLSWQMPGSSEVQKYLTTTTVSP